MKEKILSAGVVRRESRQQLFERHHEQENSALASIRQVLYYPLCIETSLHRCRSDYRVQRRRGIRSSTLSRFRLRLEILCNGSGKKTTTLEWDQRLRNVEI